MRSNPILLSLLCLLQPALHGQEIVEPATGVRFPATAATYFGEQAMGTQFKKQLLEGLAKALD